MIGTSDQSCWLAEACKRPSLEGLWMYGVTVIRTVRIRAYRNPIRICSGRRLEARVDSFVSGLELLAVRCHRLRITPYCKKQAATTAETLSAV